jgi:tetratricopeptide (TPR) repeat protein
MMQGLPLLVSVVFWTSIISFAQSWPTISASTAGSRSSVASAPLDINDQNSVVLEGRVIVTDGIPLPHPAAIQSNCAGHVDTQGYTDSKGYFIFVLHDVSHGFGTDSGKSLPSALALVSCDLQADVPGFISEKIRLSTPLDGPGVVRVGNIEIRSTSHQAGNMISATSVAAPSKAQKHFRKGCEAANKSKWDAAAERFREAVRIYPKYAKAWLYLGKVEAQQGDFDRARQSFHEALAADPNFVDAWTELAQLALRTKQWQELADDSDHMLQLNPVSMPQFWYLNSAANYELKDVDKAEKSALEGVRVDVHHRVPELQYLLGTILALKQDYRGAAEHIRHYLRLAPHAKDAEIAEKQLQQLEKLSGATE